MTDCVAGISLIHRFHWIIYVFGLFLIFTGAKLAFEKDKEAEDNRDPEIVFCLYSLDNGKIIDRFIELKKQTENWTLFGDNILLLKGRTVHSCASLAYDLLKSGGIYNLISSAFSSKYSSVVSPDALVKAIKVAKLEERKQYPETVNFKFASETVVENMEVTTYCPLWATRAAIGAGVIAAVGVGVAVLTNQETLDGFKIT